MSGHPGIVTVHDAGILADDRPYLVMELCPGGSLTRWVKADERPSQERVREVGVRIADALAAAHARGVLHRDVKPANILIDAYGNAGLADFGLAALPDPGMELSETIEAITPAYAPPEVFAGRPPTEFGDVYSLAATLYALLAGRPPRWPEADTPSVADMMERLYEPIEPHPRDQPALHGSAGCRAGRRTGGPSDGCAVPRPAQRLGPDSPATAQPEASDPAAATADQGGRPSGPGAPPGGGRQERGRDRRERDQPKPPPDLGDPGARGGAAGGRVGGHPGDLVAAGGDRGSGHRVDRVRSAPRRRLRRVLRHRPLPSASEVPAGFVDCREALGADTYCATEPECWAGIFGYTDVLWLATLQDCDKTHLYQTFAAGRLPYIPRRQSTLDDDQRAHEVCKESVLNKMLRERDQRSDWEIITLGPQAEDEDFFRCIFGRGNRGKPFKLVPPS